MPRIEAKRKAMGQVPKKPNRPCRVGLRWLLPQGGRFDESSKKSKPFPAVTFGCAAVPVGVDVEKAWRSHDGAE